MKIDIDEKFFFIKNARYFTSSKNTTTNGKIDHLEPPQHLG